MRLDLYKRSSVEIRGQRSMAPRLEVYERSVEWYTPPGIFEALGLEFDLDPCSAPGGLPWVPAKNILCAADEGLTAEWWGRCWLNPPYGIHTGKWLRRLAAHGDGIALVFARTETKWWHETVPSAHAVCFINGRLTFIDADRQPAPFNSGAPSALIAYGQDCAQAVARAGLGMVFKVYASDLPAQGSLWEVRR